jgi:hypothetical protein
MCSFPACSKAYFHARSLRKHERTHLESPKQLPFCLEALPDEDTSYEMYPTQEYRPAYSMQPQSADGYLLASLSQHQGIPQSSAPLSANSLSADAHFEQQYWGDQVTAGEA